MKLLELSKEERQEMSFIEIAEALMEERKEAIPFQDLIEEIGKVLELSDEEIRSRMLQFYTDLNVDGRFLTKGENKWGLRDWYPFDQVDEEIMTQIKPKKKKRVKKAIEEDDELLIDLEDEDIDFDDELEEDDIEDDESLEALREEEAEFEDEDEELLDDEGYEIEDEDDELDLEEEEEEE